MRHNETMRDGHRPECTDPVIDVSGTLRCEWTRIYRVRPACVRICARTCVCSIAWGLIICIYPDFCSWHVFSFLEQASRSFLPSLCLVFLSISYLRWFRFLVQQCMFRFVGVYGYCFRFLFVWIANHTSRIRYLCGRSWLFVVLSYLGFVCWWMVLCFFQISRVDWLKIGVGSFLPIGFLR